MNHQDSTTQLWTCRKCHAQVAADEAAIHMFTCVPPETELLTEIQTFLEEEHGYEHLK